MTTPTRERTEQPIDRVTWVHRDLLRSNTWNPNHVAGPEMKLLKQSILEDGWATAIVVQQVNNDDGTLDHYEIVDGFHRWTVSGDPEVYAMTGGKVPITVVAVDDAHARISTIRFNRARGRHTVSIMGDIINELSNDLDVSDDEMMERLGMTREEVVRLRERGRMVKRHRKAEGLSEAWRPVERVEE